MDLLEYGKENHAHKPSHRLPSPHLLKALKGFCGVFKQAVSDFMLFDLKNFLAVKNKIKYYGLVFITGANKIIHQIPEGFP